MALLLCTFLFLTAQVSSRQLKRDSLFTRSIFDESLLNSKNVEFIPAENFPNIFELFDVPLANSSDIAAVEYHDESLESSEEMREATTIVFPTEATTEAYSTRKPLVRDQLTQENIKTKINQQLTQRFRPLRKKKKPESGSKASEGNPETDQLQGDSTSPIAKAYGKPGEPFGGQRKPYHFAYSVKNKYGNNFNQEETSDGNTITGQYRVLLPDGRLQTVVYIADWKHGYNAVVTYEGVSKLDDQYDAPKLPKPTLAVPKALFHRPSIEKPATVEPPITKQGNNNPFNHPAFPQNFLNHPGIVQPILNHEQIAEQHQFAEHQQLIDHQKLAQQYQLAEQQQLADYQKLAQQYQLAEQQQLSSPQQSAHQQELADHQHLAHQQQLADHQQLAHQQQLADHQQVAYHHTIIQDHQLAREHQLANQQKLAHEQHLAIQQQLAHNQQSDQLPQPTPHQILNHQPVVQPVVQHPKVDKPFRPSPPDNSLWFPMQPSYGYPGQSIHLESKPIGPTSHTNNEALKSLHDPYNNVFQNQNYKINHPNQGGFSQAHYLQTIESHPGYDSEAEYNNLRYAHQFPGIPLNRLPPPFLIQRDVITNKFQHPHQRYLSAESQKSVQQSSTVNPPQSHQNKNPRNSKQSFDTNFNNQASTNLKLAGHLNNLHFVRNHDNGAVNGQQSSASNFIFRSKFQLANNTKTGQATFLPLRGIKAQYNDAPRPLPTVATLAHPQVNLMSSNGIFRPELANNSQPATPTIPSPGSAQAESNQHKVYRKHSQPNLRAKNATSGINSIMPSHNSNNAQPINVTHPVIPLPKDFIAKSIFAHINSLRSGNPIPAEAVIKSIVANVATPAIKPRMNTLRPVITTTPKSKSEKFSRGQSTSVKISRSNEALAETQIPSTATPTSHRSDAIDKLLKRLSTSTTTMTPNADGAMTEQELELLQLPLNKTAVDTTSDLHLIDSATAETSSKGKVVVMNARDNYIKIKRVRYRKTNSNNDTLV